MRACSHVGFLSKFVHRKTLPAKCFRKHTKTYSFNNKDLIYYLYRKYEVTYHGRRALGMVFFIAKGLSSPVWSGGQFLSSPTYAVARSDSRWRFSATIFVSLAHSPLQHQAPETKRNSHVVFDILYFMTASHTQTHTHTPCALHILL